MKKTESRYQPGDHEDDHFYLFNSHSHLLTEDEAKAWKNIQVGMKASISSDPLKMMMESREVSRESSVIALLSDGENEFYKRVFARIAQENPQKLNTCPQCGSLCRTSKACLCPHCSFTWYEKRST